MKKLLSIVPFIIFLASCDSSVKAEFDTIKTKKIILIGEDGKDYLLQVKNDSTGKGVLDIAPVVK